MTSGQRLTNFRARLPEFSLVPDGMVLAALDDAASETDVAIWNALHYESAVRWLAAHKLALSPFGKSAKLSTDTNTTTYETHLRTLRDLNCTGFRVTA